jgi:hypothetical protein
MGRRRGDPRMARSMVGCGCDKSVAADVVSADVLAMFVCRVRRHAVASKRFGMTFSRRRAS